MSEQTQNGIGDERLEVLVATPLNERYQLGEKIELASEILQTRRELKALRLSHKRLVEALRAGYSHLGHDGKICICDENAPAAGFFHHWLWCSAVEPILAEARKLEGK